jgi:ribosomal protein S18 acetylase RimI-like enzyme
MTVSPSSWQITTSADNDQAYAILARDRVWNSFALADLEPPLRTYSQFALAHRVGGHEHALCLVLRHPIIGQVLSPFGDEAGLDALLAHIDLPERVLIQAQEKHLPVLQRYYQPEGDWRSLWRMALPATAWRFPQQIGRQAIRRLTPEDVPALSRLYEQHPGNHFSAALFAQGMFFGIAEGEQIVAAGGTHALVPAHGLAVLGNILTASEVRGRGYATAITATLVNALVQTGFSLIVLNVLADNAPAIHIYQRLGFQMHHAFLSGNAIH